MKTVPKASTFHEDEDFGVMLEHDTETFIGVLSIKNKKTGKTCAELFCYHTKHEDHKALGFHSYTDAAYRKLGMNTLLRQVAVCLIPKLINDKISFIGSNSNEASIRIMTKHLGCTFDKQKLQLNKEEWHHIAWMDNNFTIAGPIETVSDFVREQLRIKLLHTRQSVDEFIQSVMPKLFPTVNLNDCTKITGIKREHSAVSTTSDSRPSCSKKHCPDPVTL